jgi:hypothetical protein
MLTIIPTLKQWPLELRLSCFQVRGPMILLTSNTSAQPQTADSYAAFLTSRCVVTLNRDLATSYLCFHFIITFTVISTLSQYIFTKAVHASRAISC